MQETNNEEGVVLSAYTKETYSEICEFLGLLGNKYIVKIPSKLLQLFEKNKSENYIPHIDPNIPIKDQSLHEDTLTMIAILNLKYWCEDENEIKRLKEIYKNNEDLYQEELKEKYSNDNLFKNRSIEKVVQEEISQTAMTEYKERNIFQKIFYAFINIFKKK